ncbi:fluoride efflux transporter FluC [Georgenia sp. Z1491]|uniref:fluoride efflux transporter FluC n=1 Tax=Georgenia sp. Z1491 TaxID=3416707 RepID=UPI003CEFFA06
MPHPARRPRPEHLRPGILALVVLGGTLGSGARAAIDQLAGSGPADVQWATAGINVTGAALLGVLFAVLTTMHDERARRARVVLGSGVLGGYTTYSALALQTVQLAEAGRPAVAAGYAVGSVVAGVLAAYLAHVGVLRVVRAQRRRDGGGTA